MKDKVVVPTGKTSPELNPDASVCTNDTKQLSLKTGVANVTFGTHVVMFAGQEIVGETFSKTLKVNEHSAVFPPASITFKVII
jgi:hypothetical protein